MNEQAVRRFLYALGADRLEKREGWINTHCVLAAYMHSGGVDSHPSFGVSINDSSRSVFFCFGCSDEPRSLAWLLHTLFVASGRYPWEAAKIFQTFEFHDAETLRAETPDLWIEQKKAPPKALPQKVLKKFPLLQGGKDFEARRCRSYLEQERAVPEWCQNLCRVRYDPHTSSLIFPLTDMRGDIFLMRTRSRKKKSIFTVSPAMAGFPEMKFPKLKEIGVWFGMFLIDWSRPVLLVESEMEAMRLMALGRFNVIASATSSVTDTQIDSLCADALILGYDKDKAGEHAHRKIKERVRGNANVFEADWSLVGCNDPGDLEGKDDLGFVMSNLTS